MGRVLRRTNPASAKIRTNCGFLGDSNNSIVDALLSALSSESGSWSTSKEDDVCYVIDPTTGAKYIVISDNGADGYAYDDEFQDACFGYPTSTAPMSILDEEVLV